MADDDLPTGLPRIDGDGATEDLFAELLEGAGIDEVDDEGAVEGGRYLDGSFLDGPPGESEPQEIDDLDASPTSTADWETSESDPMDDDPSMDLDDESGWVGGAVDGMTEVSTESEEFLEHAPSVLDAGEEGFADGAEGFDTSAEGALSELGAMDDDGLDEAIEIPFGAETSSDARAAHDAAPLRVERVVLSSEARIDRSTMLASGFGRALVLALDADGNTEVFVVDGGRLVRCGFAPGKARAALEHPSLGVVVATDQGLMALGRPLFPVHVRAISALGDALLALRDDGVLVLGPTPDRLEPVTDAPGELVCMTPMRTGGAVLLDARGGVHAMTLAGTTSLGRVPVRGSVAIAASARVVAVLTAGGGGWARTDADLGFEPEPALANAIAISALAEHIVALASGRLVRLGASGELEAAAWPEARGIGVDEEDVLLVLTDAGIERVVLPPPLDAAGSRDEAE